MLAFALRERSAIRTLHRQAQAGARSAVQRALQERDELEKQRLDAIRKQGESKRRAYSLEQRERQSRPEVQYIPQVSDDAAQGEAGKGSAARRTRSSSPRRSRAASQNPPPRETKAARKRPPDPPRSRPQRTFTPSTT